MHSLNKIKISILWNQINEKRMFLKKIPLSLRSVVLTNPNAAHHAECYSICAEHFLQFILVIKKCTKQI